MFSHKKLIMTVMPPRGQN